jgi:hypothetical protein
MSGANERGRSVELQMTMNAHAPAIPMKLFAR